MDSAEGRLRRMEEDFGRAPLRLLGTQLRTHREAWRHSVAVPSERYRSKDDATLLRRPVLHRRWKGPAHLRRVGTLPGATQRGFPLRTEYRANRGALAYADKD